MENYNVSCCLRSVKEGHACGKNLDPLDANSSLYLQTSLYDMLKEKFLNEAYPPCDCKGSCGMGIFERIFYFSHGPTCLTIFVDRLPLNLPEKEQGTVWRLQNDHSTSNIPDEEKNATFGAFLQQQFSDNIVDGRRLYYGYGNLRCCFSFGSFRAYSLSRPPPKLGFATDEVYEMMAGSQKSDTDLASIISESLLSLSHMSPRDTRLCHKDAHVTVTDTEAGTTVKCYYFKEFEDFRETCFRDFEFRRSISRSKPFVPVGGKSDAYFARSLDDRFLIKEVVEPELSSFLDSAPDYFTYVNGGQPSCLARIFGVFGVTSNHGVKNLLVIENLLFGRGRLVKYDLKGSERSRLTEESSETLLDQNLIQKMKVSPMFLPYEAQQRLECALSNDAGFLNSIGVMDYSLLVGVDRENDELVVGVIDYLRPYTWDKKLESGLKHLSSFILNFRNVAPTVIPPENYMNRFCKAISNYFLRSSLPDIAPKPVF